MGRRVIFLLLAVVLASGIFVWFSLSPGSEVNLETATDVRLLERRLEVAQKAHLPSTLTGNEIKALAIKAIKSGGLADRIKGIDIELSQNSLQIGLAIDVGAKVVSVSAEAVPVLTNDQLIIDLKGAKVGAVPLPTAELMKRFGDSLPPEASFDDGRLTIDLSQVNLGKLQLESLVVKDGNLILQPK